jgi:hypothetical protein
LPVSFVRRLARRARGAARPDPAIAPHLEALTGYWDLIYESLDPAGVSPGTVEDLPRSAREAGFEVAGMSGCFQTGDPGLFEVHAATLAAARERATGLGIAADRIDDLIRDIRAAKDGGCQWMSSPFYLDVTLRKPTVALRPRYTRRGASC